MNSIKKYSSTYFTENVLGTLKNTFFLTLSEVFAKGISFLWIIFLARELSIFSYGTYSYINSFILVFALLPDLGIGLIIIREIAKNPKNASKIIGNAFFINLGLSVITFALIFTSAFILGVSTEIKTLLLIASFTLFVSILRSLGIFYLEGTERMKHSAFLNALNTFLLISGGFIGFNLNLGLIGIFTGMLMGTLISIFVTWSVTARYVRSKFKFDKKLIRYLLISGIPLGLAGLASIIYFRIDTVIIGQFLGQESVGIYSAAAPLVFAVVQIINVPFMIAVYPILSRLQGQNQENFKNGILRSILFVVFVTVPITFLVFYLSDYFMPIIFNDKYNLSIPILKILILIVPFISLSALFYKVLIVLNKQLIYLYISVFGVIINISLNLYLIPKYLIIGAAYASVVTSITLFIIYSISVVVYVNKK